MGVIGKVLSAPFKAVGSLFGAGDDYTPQTVTTEPPATAQADTKADTGDSNQKQKIRNARGVDSTNLRKQGVVSTLLSQPVSGASDTVSNLGGGKR